MSPAGPVKLWYNAETDTTLYRVLVRRHANSPEKVVKSLSELPRLSPYEYEVFVGVGTVRYMSFDTMPRDLRTHITMIMAYGGDRQHVPDSRFNGVTPFLNTMPPEFDEIGWRVSENLLCVVMTDEQLDYLRGV